MSNALSALRGARKIEWILLIAAVAVLALLYARGEFAPDSTPVGTELESRMEAVLSLVEGAGRVRVLVNELSPAQPAFSTGTEKREIQGVVVVAEGAGNVRVALELARAAQTLLGIELEHIEVLPMKGGN